MCYLKGGFLWSFRYTTLVFLSVSHFRFAVAGLSASPVVNPETVYIEQYCQRRRRQRRRQQQSFDSSFTRLRQANYNRHTHTHRTQAWSSGERGDFLSWQREKNKNKIQKQSKINYNRKTNDFFFSFSLFSLAVCSFLHTVIAVAVGNLKTGLTAVDWSTLLQRLVRGYAADDSQLAKRESPPQLETTIHNILPADPLRRQSDQDDGHSVEAGLDFGGIAVLPVSSQPSWAHSYHGQSHRKGHHNGNDCLDVIQPGC